MWTVLECAIRMKCVEEREREREREVYREERLGLMMCVCRVFIFKVTGPTPLRDGVRHKADVPTHLSPR